MRTWYWLYGLQVGGYAGLTAGLALRGNIAAMWGISGRTWRIVAVCDAIVFAFLTIQIVRDAFLYRGDR